MTAILRLVSPGGDLFGRHASIAAGLRVGSALRPFQPAGPVGHHRTFFAQHVLAYAGKRRTFHSILLAGLLAG